MREKRLRRQEMEDEARTSAEAKPPEKQTSDITLKRKAPAEVSLITPGSLLPSSNTPDTTSSTQKVPVRKLIPLKSKTASPLNSSITPDTTAAAVTTVTSVSVKQSEPEDHSQSPSSSRKVPDQKTSNASALSPAKQARAAPQGPTDEAPTADATLNNNQKTSPERTTDTKGTSPLMLSYMLHFPAHISI